MYKRYRPFPLLKCGIILQLEICTEIVNPTQLIPIYHGHLPHPLLVPVNDRLAAVVCVQLHHVTSVDPLRANIVTFVFSKAASVYTVSRNWWPVQSRETTRKQTGARFICWWSHHASPLGPSCAPASHTSGCPASLPICCVRPNGLFQNTTLQQRRADIYNMDFHAHQVRMEFPHALHALRMQYMQFPMHTLRTLYF